MLKRYRILEQRLRRVRGQNQGRETVQEERILEAMERAWWLLIPSEQHLLDQEGPRCWPLSSEENPE